MFYSIEYNVCGSCPQVRGVLPDALIQIGSFKIFMGEGSGVLR